MSKDKINVDQIKKALEKKKKLDKKNKIINTYDGSTFPKKTKIDDGLPKIKNTYDGSTFPKKIIIDDDMPKIKNTYGPNRTSQKSDKQNLRSGGLALRGLGRAFMKGGKV